MNGNFRMKKSARKDNGITKLGESHLSRLMHFTIVGQCPKMIINVLSANKQSFVWLFISLSSFIFIQTENLNLLTFKSHPLVNNVSKRAAVWQSWLIQLYGQNIFCMHQSSIQISEAMDNYRRGLHSHLGAGAKTSLGVCLTELKH